MEPTAISAIVALAGAVVALFKLYLKLTEKFTGVSSRVGLLEGRQDGIKNLSEKTLDVVHKAIVERDKENPK